MSRDDVIRAAAQALLDRSENGQLVVGVDDAHLLDDHSAVLLHDLAVGAGAFVVVTVRSGEVAPDPITSLWKDGLCDRFEIQALSEPEVGALVEAALTGQVEGATKHRLFERTRGNPLYLREIVLGGIEEGSLVETEGLWRWPGSITPSRRLADLIAARLQGLQPEDRDALEIVAVGEPLELGILQTLVTAEVLQKLERLGLVGEEGDRRRVAVRTSHPLYAEAVRAAAASARIRTISGHLAAALEATGSRRKGDPLRLATWGLEAGMKMRPELLIRGAGLALAVLDYDLGERLARAGFESGGGGSAGMVLTQALIGQGRFENADDLLVRLHEAAPTGRDRARIALARAQNLMWNMDSGAAALELLRIEAEGAREPDTRDELLAGSAHLLFFVGRVGDAVAIGKRVLERPDAPEPILYNAASAAGQALMWAGRPDEAMEIWHRWEDVIVRGQRDVLYGPVGRAMYWTVDAYVAGRLKDAMRLSEAAYAEVIEAGADWVRGLLVGLVGWMALARGHVRTATKFLQEGAALLQVNIMSLRSVWLAELAYALALLNEPDEAQRTLDEAERVRVPSVMFHDILSGPAHVWTAVSRGEISRAIAIALDRADAQVASGVKGSEAILLHDAARLGEAGSVTERLARLAEDCDGQLIPAFARHAAALVVQDGPALDQISGDFEDMGADLLAAEAAAEASRAYRDQGKTASAFTARARAKALAGLCEGARTPALEGIEEPLPLTPREREVATLASRGLSNKDIADRLTVSVRTVENQLHTAFAKLGITRRDELTAILRPIASAGRRS
jgi:DNA-binding CsgD family transcriptional regulator